MPDTTIPAPPTRPDPFETAISLKVSLSQEDIRQVMSQGITSPHEAFAIILRRTAAWLDSQETEDTLSEEESRQMSFDITADELVSNVTQEDVGDLRMSMVDIV